MEPKPIHLGPEYAAQFRDASVVRAYKHRPPYPADLRRRILSLLGEPPVRLLDLGCGPGELTRALAPDVAAITAIDQSEGMIAAARQLPGGSHPHISWKIGPVESTPLEGPFSVALAAQSFHWFDWQDLVPRLAEAIPSRRLIIVDGRGFSRAPWWTQVAKLIPQFSTNTDYKVYDAIEEITRRGLFAAHGDESLLGPPFKQHVDDYLESIHSRNGFSRDRMNPGQASLFDSQVRALVGPHAIDGFLSLRTACRITWGAVASAA